MFFFVSVLQDYLLVCFTYLYTGIGYDWAPQVKLKSVPCLKSKYSTVFPLLKRGATDPIGTVWQKFKFKI